MTTPSRLHLFQAYGIELEYMIVDKDSLDVKPIADELLRHELGTYGSDYENGLVTWSNELVLHVIEIKSTNPESNLSALASAFSDNVRKINAVLESHHAMLLPGAAHPLMNPLRDTRLWPHDSTEIYDIYNRVFDCKGHGWSNLQSTHLNLPFYDDEEFARLHAAVRTILPILPALCASSPVLDGKPTGWLDTRLNYYRTNQSKIPSITGKVIPEPIFSKRNYLNTIYDKIKADIASYDAENVLNPIWVNSRGAIPRFDRGSIEIRVMDVQECPAADMAIVHLVVETLKALVNERFAALQDQMKLQTDPLAMLLGRCAQHGQQAIIDSAELLDIFGMSTPCTARELWQHILGQLSGPAKPTSNWSHELRIILTEGTLADRILKSLGSDLSPDGIRAVYRNLARCLSQDRLFVP